MSNEAEVEAHALGQELPISGRPEKREAERRNREVGGLP